MSKHRRAIRLTAKERRRAKPIPPAYTLIGNGLNGLWSSSGSGNTDYPLTTTTNTTNLYPCTIQYNGNSYTLSLDPNTNNWVF